MKKKKARFNSLSTPGARQDVSNYLTELAFFRSNRQIKLPPKFWQQTKYKFRYRREIQAVRKFIKKYGEGRVLSVAISNYIMTWTNYGSIEAKLQKIKEHEELRTSPKDFTPPTKEVFKSGPDLRAKHGIMKITKGNKGLFQKLKELEK